MRSWLPWRTLAIASLALAGCASTAGPGAGGEDPDRAAEVSAVDPYETANRTVFEFNEALDRVLVKPAAQGYEAAVPRLFRDMVGNFFANLGDLWISTNQLLQGKPGEAFADLSRFVVNTTVGFAGLADVASEMGLDKHDEDLGQTLAVWGIPSGPYLVLPILGPSSFRDAPARVVDLLVDPTGELGSGGLGSGFWALRLLDTRVRLFAAERVREAAAFDKYSFTRDSWLQRRRNQVYDGNPPLEEDEE